MFYKIKSLLLLIFIYSSAVVSAGRYDAAEWLTLNPSPRAAAMGVAYYGVAAGAYSSLFNPAAPAFIRNREVKAQYGLLPAGITYNSLAYLEPAAGPGTASLSVRNLLTDSMTKLKEGKKDGSFSNSDIAFGLGYGVKVTDEITTGLNLRGIQSTIAGNSSAAFGGDAGVFTRFFNGTKAGLAVHNIFTPIKYRSTREDLPLFISAGLSQNFNLESDAVNFTLSAGCKYMDYGEWIVGAGVEHIAYDQFAVRAGYEYDNKLNRLKFPSGLSAGVGIDLFGVLADYSWVPYGQMGYTHRIGLGYKFKSSGKVRKAYLSVDKNIYSPETGELTIYIKWGGIKNREKHSIIIKDSYGIKIKEIYLSKDSYSVKWDGKEEGGKYALDGNYLIQLVKISPEKTIVQAELDIIVDNTPPEFKIDYSTDTFSPDDDGKNDSVVLSVEGGDDNKFASYNIKIYNSAGKIVKKFAGSSVPIKYTWKGIDDYYEQPVKEGAYSVVASASDIAGNTKVLEKTVLNVRFPPKIVTKTIKIQEEKEGLKINLKSQVLFTQGKTTLKEESHESLDEVVSVLEAYDKNLVSIEGHTDSVGSEEVNKKISLDRAAAVRDYLLENGISSERIKVKGWGETKPIATNRTRAGQMANRRVEIIILKDKIE